MSKQLGRWEILDEVWPENEAQRMNLTEFSIHRLGHRNIAPMHEEWDRRLEEMFRYRRQQKGPKFGCLLAPFQHGKSERATVNFPLWAILRDPEIRILNVSAVAKQAKRHVGMVFGLIGAHYPHLKPSDPEAPWGTQEFAVKRAGKYAEATYTAMGLFGSGITGSHFDIILADDLCTQANTRTPFQRRQTGEFVRMTLLGRLTPGGFIVIIGSRWHHQDFYKEVLENPELVDKFTEPKGFTTVHKAILEWPGEGESEGVMAWPEKEFSDGGWSWGRLMDLWSSMGSMIASLQMQNDPQPTVGEQLQAEWIQDHSFDFAPGARGDLPSSDKLAQGVISVDPAFSTEEPGDWCAAACLVKDKQGGIWLVDAWHWHKVWTNFLTSELEGYYHKWRNAISVNIPWNIVIEENSFGTQAEFRERMKLLRRHEVLSDLPLVSVRTSTGKEARFGTRAAFYENGTIRVNSLLVNPGHPFHDEWVGFPNADHDDVVDAVDIGLQRLLPKRRQPYKSLVF